MIANAQISFTAKGYIDKTMPLRLPTTAKQAEWEKENRQNIVLKALLSLQLETNDSSEEEIQEALEQEAHTLIKNFLAFGVAEVAAYKVAKVVEKEVQIESLCSPEGELLQENPFDYLHKGFSQINIESVQVSLSE